MLGRKEELNLQFLQFVDGFLLVIGFWLAHTVRFFAPSWFAFDRPIGPFSEFQWLLFIIFPFGPLVLEVQGFYTQPLHHTFGKALGQFLRMAIWLGLIIASAGFFLRLSVPSRTVMPLFGLCAALLVMGRDRITQLRLRRRMQRNHLREPVILAGTKADLHEFRHTFTPEQIMRTEVVEEIDLETQPVADLVHALHRHSVSRVIFAGRHAYLHHVEEAIAACEVEGVEAWLVADFIRTAIARPTFDVFGARPMLVFRTTPDISWELFFKDALDRVGALLGLAVLALPMLGIGLLIRLTSPGAAIFRQQRGGKNGRPFTMFKFRTMEQGAPQRHSELAAQNEMRGPVFKLENDPRITSIGRFLRRTSLDELPQLWNVLRGEMSLVGPRPLPLYEVERFENTAQRRRLSMKPGLTCLWQVSGRNNIQNFADWVRLDLEYIDNWSLWLDLQILLRTLPVVLLGRGAK